MKRTAALPLLVGFLATSGCISAHVVNDKARTHLEYSVEDQQQREVQGQPAYYAILPLTIAGDAVTLPFQLMYLLSTDKFHSHGGLLSIDGIPIPLP